jgi:hypothetical protein
MNLCSIKNIIQLFNLDLDEIGDLFSSHDLRNSLFQDSVTIVLLLGKCFKLLTEKKFGLDEHIDVPDKLISSTFKEETNFLDSDTMLILKRHYVTHYRQLRKEFLNHLEDSMIHDFLLGSTISTVSKKDTYCVSKISSPSILTVNTEISKRSAKYNAHDFYPKNFNHTFLPNPEFENYRNDVKKRYEYYKNMLDVNEHQMTDHPSTFMKMIKGRVNAMSAENNEISQVLNPRVTWDGSMDRFEVFRNNVEGHYGQIGAEYLFDAEFQTAYFERGTDCYVNFLDEVPSASQIKKDASTMYGALISAYQGGIGSRILIESRNKQDGIQA